MSYYVIITLLTQNSKKHKQTFEKKTLKCAQKLQKYNAIHAGMINLIY